MINAAVVIDDHVDNIIYISEKVMAEWQENGQELIDRETCGLAIGDYRQGETWYRDIDGEPVELPLPENVPSDYLDLAAYYQAMKEVIE